MEKHKRGAVRYLIVFAVYAAAIAVGTLLACTLPLPVPLSLLIADVVATVVVFIYSATFGNASLYDPYWSVQPIVIGIGLACTRRSTATCVLPLLAIVVWGVRLTANWVYTFKGLDPKFQDWRYTMLKEKTGKLYPLVNFFGIHLIPTLVVYACMLPVIYLFLDVPAFNAGSAVFFLLSLAAVGLEGIADCTMHKFKKEGGTGFLRKGVWKYSRHPNYLGEISFWWTIALAALCVAPARWWTMAGALLNTLLFLFVSIPMADKHQARKPAFALYRKNTRMLFPVYKKQSRK